MLSSNIQWLLAIAVSISFTQSNAALIPFPSGYSFETVSPDASKTSKDAHMFDGQTIKNKKLSLSFKVKDFKDSSQDLFRAEPVLFTCLQKLQMVVQASNERIEILSGYVPAASAGSSHHDAYQSTGTAVRIQLKPGGGSMTYEQLTKAAIKTCFPIFLDINRDIGIALYTDKLQIHIQGPDEPGPYYYTDSGVSTVFPAFALDAIDEAYDLPSTGLCPDDATSPSLKASGELYPDSVSTLEEAVGGLDKAIKRADTIDFGKLGYYPGRWIEYEDSESASSWCGEVGKPCGNCGNNFAGGSLKTRCADRTMSYRLLRFLRSIGKATAAEWPGVKLKVLEAWDEPHSGNSATGDQPLGSLHHEGRAAIVVASDGDASKLTRISAFAICAGTDAVMHMGTHLVFAALKQKDKEARTITFADNQELVEVAPPDALTDMYKLRVEFSDTEALQYPLFDSADRHAFKLSQNVTLGMFVPEDGRYLRLSPVIVSCMQSLIVHEAKYEEDTPLLVCKSYLNAVEVDNYIDIFDKRYSSAGLGLSMELSINCDEDSTDVLDLYEQMQRIVEQCAPLFYRADGKNMGIGLYNRFIAVDIRPNFKAWADNEDLRELATEAEFEEYYQRWATRAIQGRVVDPIDPVLACQVNTKPSKQDFNFKHAFAEVSFEDDGADDPDQCVPMSDTDFCTNTKKHRDKEIERLWKEATRKHLYHENRTELYDALQGCIGTCGTCSEGAIWNTKLEHCNNYLHWAPFNFLNDCSEDSPGDDVNIYLQETIELKHYACDRHCLNKAPLWAQMVTTMEKLYRPNEEESVQEKLFSIANNPSPVMQLMNNIYAMSAKGLVKVWVKDETELITMREILKHIFLYNFDVTKVNIYVMNSPNKEIVASVVNTFFTEWTQGGCLEYSREFLPPFEVFELPSHMSKRSAQYDVRETLLHRHRNWENQWINGHPLL